MITLNVLDDHKPCSDGRAAFVALFGPGPYPCTRAWLVALAAGHPSTRPHVGWAIGRVVSHGQQLSVCSAEVHAVDERRQVHCATLLATARNHLPLA